MTIRLSPLLSELIAELERIPGLGPRSAQRAAFHMLREGQVPNLRRVLEDVSSRLHRCPLCNTFTEKDVCDVCADETRSPVHLCIVESVGDQMALDASLAWGGQYYVLDGRINPIEGRGPEAIGLRGLFERLHKAEVEGRPFEEVVVATSYTPEGDATAYYLIEALGRRWPKLHVTRLARGLPSGIEIEYTDLNTLANAVIGRRGVARSEDAPEDGSKG